MRYFRRKGTRTYHWDQRCKHMPDNVLGTTEWEILSRPPAECKSCVFCEQLEPATEHGEDED